MIIKISESAAGQRLDKFLTRQLKNLSRSQIQKLIKFGLIFVNNQPALSHYCLKLADLIKIKSLSPEIETAKSLLNKKNLAVPIIFETADFLVINKPAGLIAHGSSGSLADWLKEKYPAISSVGDDPARPGIVHRLDKDVSGLMVIAKTNESFNSLKKQFQKRTIIKEYTALAHGKIAKDADLINFPIKRSQKGYKMAALPATDKGEPSLDGRQAQTKFWVIKKFINYTLLKVKIITGRTHQIRAHLAAYGHPLAGDNIYATAKTRRQNKKLGLNRIFLIADRLAFKDLTGQRRSYKINLPDELKNILKQVK